MIRLFILLLFVPASLLAVDVKVGAEVSPPLVTADGGGRLMEALKSFEKVSDLRFIITVMPYNRAVKELKLGRRDLIFQRDFRLKEVNFTLRLKSLHGIFR